MTRKKTPPPCETLTEAARHILRMPMSEYRDYSPQTAAEKAADTLMTKALRGDVRAFHELIIASDSIEVLQDAKEQVDALSASLAELAETL